MFNLVILELKVRAQFVNTALWVFLAGRFSRFLQKAGQMSFEFGWANIMKNGYRLTVEANYVVTPPVPDCQSPLDVALLGRIQLAGLN